MFNIYRSEFRDIVSLDPYHKSRRKIGLLLFLFEEDKTKKHIANKSRD